MMMIWVGGLVVLEVEPVHSMRAALDRSLGSSRYVRRFFFFRFFRDIEYIEFKCDVFTTHRLMFSGLRRVMSASCAKMSSLTSLRLMNPGPFFTLYLLTVFTICFRRRHFFAVARLSLPSGPNSSLSVLGTFCK